MQNNNSPRKRHELSPEDFAEEFRAGHAEIPLHKLREEVDKLARVEYQNTFSTVTNAKKSQAIMLMLIQEVQSLRARVERFEKNNPPQLLQSAA